MRKRGNMENNLKQIINERGLKAKWISRQLNPPVHETEPSQWVAGRRRPRNDQIKQLAKLLKVRVKDLYPDYRPQ